MGLVNRIFCFAMTVCMATSCVSGVSVKANEESFSFEIPASYDTYLRKGYTNDYSRETTMIVDGRASSERVGLVQFKYGLDESDSAEVITETANQIVLRIRMSQNLGTPKMAIYGVRDKNMKSSWEYDKMNYDLAKNLNILSERGTDTVPLLAVKDMESVAASEYLEFDVTEYVKEQMLYPDENGGGEFVFLICGMDAYSPNDYFRVYADNGQGTTSADNVPKLVISSGGEGYLAKDVMSLDIEKKHQVTEDFTLPTVLGGDRASGTQSYIEWRSDTDTVISLERDGDTYIAHVTRPPSSKHSDAVVTLTADITNGDLSESKSFKLYVPPVGVYNASLTNYVMSSSETTNPNGVVYAYVKSSTKYVGFIKFRTDDNAFSYAPKAVLRVKPYFMQGAFTLTMTPIGYDYSDGCTDSMTWKTSTDLINDKGRYSVTDTQDPSQTDWIEWDVTDYVNSLTSDAVFKFEIDSTGTSYCIFYGNAEKYIPQLKLYNYETVTDAEKSVNSVVKTVEEEIDEMRSTLDAVTSDIDLPSPEKYGVEITWSAYDENGEVSQYIGEDGTLLKQPENEDVQVTLRAVVSRGDYHPIAVETSATVLRKASDEEAAAFNEKNLKLNSEILTSKGTLPQGLYGAKIEWFASPTDYIEITDDKYKVLKRSTDCDTDAVITAKISKGESAAEKSFDVKILRSNQSNLLYGLRILNDNTAMENTNDDNISTYYSQDTDFNIDYALLKEESVNNVMVVPYNSENIKKIEIYLSDDAVKWEKVEEAAVKDGINQIYFQSSDASYLRIAVKVSGKAGIREVGAYYSKESETNVSAKDILNSTEFIKLSGLPSGVVKKDFELKKKVDGAEVKWYSENENILSLTEKQDVYLASPNKTDKTQGVKLKAVVTINSTIAEKEFSISISGNETGLISSSSGGGSTKPSVNLQETPPPLEEALDTEPSATDMPIKTEEPKIHKFTDINQALWAEEYITKLYVRGVVNGRTEREFMPLENITREEFVKLIAEALNIRGGECDFLDVPDDAWYYPYIASAVSTGLISGIGGGNFGTSERITRQDMAVIIARVLKEIPTLDEDVEFKDKDEISDYAADAVKKLSSLGIMMGDENGRVNPKSFATRAEACKMVCMMLEETEKTDE